MPENSTSLRRILRRRKLKVVDVANDIGTSAAQISRLASGKRRMTRHWADRLAPALDVDAVELLDEHGRPTVPLTTAIRLRDGEAAEEGLRFPQPWERIHTLSTLASPEECFAAEVLDNSANQLYPQGSILIARRLQEPAKLRSGAKVIVERYATSRRADDVEDILVGLVQVSIAGGLQVATVSTNRRLLGAIQIKPSAIEARRGLGEQAQAAFDGEVDYMPAADDPAAIIGRVEISIITET